MIEDWKPILGFEQFEISNTGKIRNSKTGRVLKITLNKTTGYMGVTVSLGKRGNSKHLRVHKVLADSWLPNPESKPFVNHKDGIKTNNSLENLEWVSAAENIQHAYDNNLIEYLKGSDRYNAALTEQEVVEIRNKYKTGGFSQRELAEQYNVGKTTVWGLLNKHSWTHV